MKYALISLLIGASTAQAESLCNVTDIDTVLSAIDGAWVATGAISIETETLSITEPFELAAMVNQDAQVSAGLLSNGYSIRLDDLGPIYDVDQVDDMLDTVEAAWITEAVADTRCGPEGLLQLSGPITSVQGSEGTITLLPYFSDRIVIITEYEVKGDWGIGFVTVAGLLERD